MKRLSRDQASASFSTRQEGRVVSHLKELLDANDLSVPQLAARLGVADLRPLYALRNNTVRAFDFDLLARICAIFDVLPLATLLEYVPLGAEPEARYVRRDIEATLPCPYGGIRCLILEHRNGTTTTQYFEQLADEMELHWSTLAKLANYHSKAVRASTLATLCQHLGGIAQVYVYDPDFIWQEAASGARSRA
jgi:DNA-binding Xre family transcriptional regulator